MTNREAIADGANPLAEQRGSAPAERAWDPEAARRYEERELAWRRSVGWIK